MRVTFLRWLLVVLLAALTAAACSAGSPRVQNNSDQPPAVQPGPDAAPPWEAEVHRTLLSIQNALRREEAPAKTWIALAVELGRPILIIGLYVAALVGVLWLWSASLRLFPRGGTVVSFDDLSVPRADRPEKSRILTQAILDLLQNPRPAQMSDLQMDIMPGIKEPGFGNLQPAITMVSVGEYEPSENPMKIGMVEFSIRDIRALVSRHFSRPHKQSLEGWLVEEDGAFHAGARLLDVARKPVPKAPPLRHGESWLGGLFRRRSRRRRSVDDQAPTLHEWRVRRTGDDARFEALADLAAQILVDTGNSTLTNSWQSFRSFNRALGLRDGQEALKTRDAHQRGGSSTLAAARHHLERAVAHDPSNWIARFNLALTLSRDGDAEVALKHLTMLEKVVARAWPLVGMKRDSHQYQQLRVTRPTFCSVVDHLKDYPECAFLILYNKAVAVQHARGRAFAGPSDHLQQAAHIFAQISRLDAERVVHLDDPYPQIASCGWLSERSRVELSLYALSALADLLAQAPEVRTPRDKDRDLSRADQIASLFAEVESLCERKQEEHWRSLQTARAVTLTAHAVALQNEGRFEDARDALLSALAAEPRFVKASLRLADLYVHQARPGWFTDATSVLQRVLDINPSCQDAAERLSKLSRPAVAAL
jgi:tetratricopeptide (TPR) repeat protein